MGNLKDLISRKSINMVWTQAILLGVLLLILFKCSFDPQRVEALLLVIWKPLLAIAGVGSAALVSQGVADMGRPRSREVAAEEAKIELERAKAKAVDRAQ